MNNRAKVTAPWLKGRLLLFFIDITYKHLSAVRGMVDIWLLDYAAHQTGTLFSKGECVAQRGQAGRVRALADVSQAC